MNPEWISSVPSSCSVVSDSLRPYERQHNRPPCSSTTRRNYPNSCPLSRWCHLTISSSVVSFFSCPQSLPALGSFFQWVNFSHEVAKVLEFQLQHSPSNEYSGLISFKMDWLDLLAIQGTFKSFPTPQLKNINSLALSFLNSSALT